MSFRLHPGRAVDAELRRIACAQIDKATAELSEAGSDRDEAIHDARKRLKKLRGLVRLAGAGAKPFVRSENRRWRDAGRALSALRDRAALVEAADALEARFAEEVANDEVATDAFAHLREAMARREDGNASERDAAVRETLLALAEGRRAVESLHLPAHGRGRAAAARGAEQTFAHARRALGQAARTREADDFHELRKQMKYYAMHLKLFGPLWPEAMDALREAADRVAEDLGRDHDYAVLRAAVAAKPEHFGRRADLDVVIALLDRHQGELRERALEGAGRLLAERPKAFRRRLARLYDLAAARPDPDAPPETPVAARRRAGAPAS